MTIKNAIFMEALPELPEKRALPVLASGIPGYAKGYTADQMSEYGLLCRRANTIQEAKIVVSPEWSGAGLCYECKEMLRERANSIISAQSRQSDHQLQSDIKVTK